MGSRRSLSFDSNYFSIGWSLLLLVLTIISHCVMSNHHSNPSRPVVPHPDIRIVFSDLDGTLIHYPNNTTAADSKTTSTTTTTTNTTHNDNDDDDAAPEKTPMIITLPASSTGLTGTLTRETMALCRVIRRGRSSRGGGGGSCKLAFISGMRFNTLLSRIPYLPRADAYACDSGGRIFIAHDDHPNDDDNMVDDNDHLHNNSSVERSNHDDNDVDDQMNNNSSNRARTSTTRQRRRKRRKLLKIVPVDPLDEPFYLTEDMAWRKRIAAVVGSDGYVGHELLTSTFVTHHHNNEEEERTTLPTTTSPSPLPLTERRGPLWTCANALLQHRSPTMNTIRIDTTGYATCFRINRQHNNGTVFDDLLASLHNNNNNNNTGRFDGILDPALLTTSVNLGCIDVVPVVSGKKNWYEYSNHMCVVVGQIIPTNCLIITHTHTYIYIYLKWPFFFWQTTTTTAANTWRSGGSPTILPPLLLQPGRTTSHHHYHHLLCSTITVFVCVTTIMTLKWLSRVVTLFCHP
jgi:hypothetical protein